MSGLDDVAAAAARARLGVHAVRGGDASQLARSLGMAPSPLRSLIAEGGATTLAGWLRMRRLEHAHTLLRHGDAHIDDVARFTGHRGAGALADALPNAAGAVTGRTRFSAALFLPAAQPFAPAALTNFFALRCMPAVETMVDADGEAGYRRGWQGPRGRGTVVFRALPEGVLIELEGRGRLPLNDIVERARRMFDLDAPVAEIAQRLGGDPVLAASLAQAPGRRVPGNWDPFELAVRAVLGQQVSVVAARTHANRLLEMMGIRGPDALFPTAVELADADISALAMPGARRAALKTLARAVADGDVDLRGPVEQVHASLLALRGIGPWTADYIAMRGLKHRDAFPAGDLVVRQALAGGGRLPTEAAVRLRAQDWRPVRAYAVLHLWASVGAGG